MISKICYTLYKEDWKRSHMISREIEMDCIREYYECFLENNKTFSYNDYIERFGYNGELYVSFQEFLYNEYLDKEYVYYLLQNEKLKALYEKDLENDI